jgi:hypothetical protein
VSTYLPCPNCPIEIEVSEVDPDASLTDLWDHLMRHPALTAPARERAFVKAQRDAHQ